MATEKEAEVKEAEADERERLAKIAEAARST